MSRADIPPAYELSHIEKSISYEFAAARIKYDPLTGSLFRIKGRRSGKVAGHLSADGYWRVSVDNKQVQGHRLAWLLAHGGWPLGLIDHIDGDPSNNRLANLRIVNHAQNTFNRSVDRRSGTKVRGVRRTPSGTFCVTIKVAGRRINLGTFKTIKAAADKYAEAAAIYHGSYARASSLPSEAPAEGRAP